MKVFTIILLIGITTALSDGKAYKILTRKPFGPKMCKEHCASLHWYRECTYLGDLVCRFEVPMLTWESRRTTIPRYSTLSTTKAARRTLDKRTIRSFGMDFGRKYVFFAGEGLSRTCINTCLYVIVETDDNSRGPPKYHQIYELNTMHALETHIGVDGNREQLYLGSFSNHYRAERTVMTMTYNGSMPAMLQKLSDFFGFLRISTILVLDGRLFMIGRSTLSMLDFNVKHYVNVEAGVKTINLFRGMFVLYYEEKLVFCDKNFTTVFTINTESQWAESFVIV